MKPVRLTHRFVDYIPEPLERGVLYVSLTFTTAVHLCACGCGSTVVTPLSPTDWSLTFDGTTVSLSPSVGNWSYPCQSHYWIRHDTVSWASRFTPAQIADTRARTGRTDSPPSGRPPLTVRIRHRLRRALDRSRTPGPEARE
ncbi:DUF6527 family protein [Streptomyces sp. NPDC002698]|uniref:DUF6527 family protein n=1 Tax=Streptomyces sp. NPDC002698 TaxID=3364660 RepID=UPI0036B48EFE